MEVKDDEPKGLFKCLILFYMEALKAVDWYLDRAQGRKL